jgi:small-conductance mechanosensitive channel
MAPPWLTTPLAALRAAQATPPAAAQEAAAGLAVQAGDTVPSGPLTVLFRTLGEAGASPSALLGNAAFLGVLGQILGALLVLLVGFPLLFALGRGARRWVGARYSPQRGMVAGKIIYYVGGAILVLTVLGQLQIRLAPLLGAAGIVGVAIGFASQTSISNVISGLFLVAEQPFRVDDVIRVGTTSGKVISIDMLSVKLRTFDNLFIRIPNETIIKSEVVTLTRFPIRRIELLVGVAYREEMERVRRVLLDVAGQNPMVLMEPEPAVMFEEFGSSSVNFRFVAWATRENFLAARDSLADGIKARFEVEGIEIPFPHQVSVFPEGFSEPFPVRVAGHPAEGQEGEAGADGGKVDRGEPGDPGEAHPLA